MAKTIYNPATTHGKLTAELVQKMYEARNLALRIKECADRLAGVNYINLEVGTPGADVFGVATGSGQAFYDAIVSIKAAADTVTVATLSQMDFGS